MKRLVKDSKLTTSGTIGQTWYRKVAAMISSHFDRLCHRRPATLFSTGPICREVILISVRRRAPAVERTTECWTCTSTTTSLAWAAQSANGSRRNSKQHRTRRPMCSALNQKQRHRRSAFSQQNVTRLTRAVASAISTVFAVVTILLAVATRTRAVLWLIDIVRLTVTFHHLIYVGRQHRAIPAVSTILTIHTIQDFDAPLILLASVETPLVPVVILRTEGFHYTVVKSGTVVIMSDISVTWYAQVHLLMILGLWTTATICLIIPSPSALLVRTARRLAQSVRKWTSATSLMRRSLAMLQYNRFVFVCILVSVCKLFWKCSNMLTGT